MKKIQLLSLMFLLTNCDTSNKVESEEFFRNSAFVDVHKSDTTWISFQDSTYEIWTIRGQQQKATWKLNEIKNIEFLTLGDYCPGVYEIQKRDDKKMVLKELITRKTKVLTFTRIDPQSFERRIKKIKTVANTK